MNRSFGGSLDCNSVNYNKGKSFRFSEWNSSTLYSNDDYIQDFVSYMGSMYACIQTNTAVEPTNELYWKLVVSGQPGVQGKQGNTGVTFTPHVDADGNLSWTNDGGLENPQTVNIKGPKGADSTVPGPKGDKGDNGIGLTGPQGRTGETGIGLEFNWDGTKLGIKRTVDDEYTYVDLKGTTGARGLKGNTGNPGPEGPKGPKGDSLYIQVSEPNEFGQRFLQKRYSESEAWVSFFDLSQMKGPKGDSIIVERNLETGNIEYRYENQPSSANKILIYKDDIKGPKGDTIAKTYIADDGYLYIQLSGEDLPRRVGYVRGDRGADGREIVLRVYTGPSEDPNDPRIGTHLQWKYAGDEYKLWTNLIQINELMNIALSGIKIEYELLTEPNEVGIDTKYNVIELNTYQVEFDEKNNLVLTKKIANLSSVKVPIETHLRNVTYTNEDHILRFFFETATGEDVLPISLDDLATEFIDKVEDLRKQHELDVQELNQSIDNINKIINEELRPNIQKNTEDIAKLREDLTTETSNRENADNQLQSNIDTEVVRATNAEQTIQTSLDNEISRSKQVDQELIAKTDKTNQDLLDTNNNLSAEILRATNAESEIYDHIHEVEATIDGKIDESEKGQPNGVATLDENGFIPSTQINGQMAHVFGVDGVATASTLPTLISSDAGDIYWTTDTKEFYNWNGLSWDDPMAPKDDTIYNFRNCDATGDPSRTNILYRWDGKNLTEISESLALGEVTGTAYEGNKGAANRAAINSTPESLVSTLNISSDTSKVDINLETAVKSGLNYNEVTSVVKNIPNATKLSAGIITSSEYTSLVETIPNKLVELETELSNKQEVGDYATKSEIPTKVSELENDSNFLTSIPEEYVTDTELQEAISGVQFELPVASSDVLGGIKIGAGLSITDDGILSATGGGVADSVAWENVVGRPTNLSQFTNDSGFITSDDLPDLSDYALKSEIPTDYLVQSDLDNYATKDEIKNNVYVIGRLFGYLSPSTETITEIIGGWENLRQAIIDNKVIVMDDTVASGQSKRTSCPISAVISSENVIILSCFGRYNNISPYGGILTGQLTKTGEELSWREDVSFVTTETLNSSQNCPVSGKVIYAALQQKQDTLVSGTNIKTINGTSLLGSGNITIEAGGGSEIMDVLDNKTYARTQGTWIDLTDWLTWAEYD